MASAHHNQLPTPNPQSLQSPLDLIEQTGQHIRRQRTINILSFFVPIGVATAIVSYVVLSVFALPLLLILIPLGIWAAFFATAVRRTQTLGGRQMMAGLLDTKTLSKERFLTLATLPESQHQPSLLPLLQRDTTQRATSFRPERDLPFHLDRRVPIGAIVSVLSVGAAFLLFLLPAPTLSGLVPAPLAPAPDQPDAPQLPLSTLEETAKKLATEGKTPEERAAGAELVALAEKLKNPSLTPKERERLIDEAEERMTLDLPLPQILPIDLKMFASESENDEGDGNQSDAQQPNDKVLAKSNDPSAKNKQNPSSQNPQDKGNSQPQQGQQQSNRKDGQQKDQNNQQDGDTQPQPKPQEAGGELKFDQPQQQGDKKKQPSQQQSGEQQQSASQHDPNQKMQGGDPNQPGEQNKPSPDPNKPGPNPDPRNADQKGQGKGKNPGRGKAERFVKPGEKVGGFLTKDARFVKVRVPAGYERPGESSQRTTRNNTQAQPKTPYSNAPLKKGPANTSEPSQLIPLEYRNILK